MDLSLEQKIEALLFYKNHPLSASELASLLNCPQEEITRALTELAESLRTRGITLINANGAYRLATHPHASPLIKKIAADEVSGELSRAAQETLTVILYHHPISKTQIDYIRGVNSYVMLRTLLVRGLIRKEPSPNDQRTFLFSPTPELLAHLGISSPQELPEYNEYRAKIQKTIDEQDTEILTKTNEITEQNDQR